jgi:carboxyl-terminal processing protease
MSNHKARINNNPDFLFLNKQIERLNEQRNKTHISLNMKERKAEREALELASLELENERRRAKGEKVFKTVEEMNEFNSEQDADKKPAQDDAIVVESGEILLDLISMNEVQISAN